jgi:hypothetical protein
MDERTKCYIKFLKGNTVTNLRGVGLVNVLLNMSPKVHVKEKCREISPHQNFLKVEYQWMDMSKKKKKKERKEKVAQRM